MLRVQFHTRLKTAKFLQCISIAFVQKFAYEALCSDCETHDVLYGSDTGLLALARGQSGLDLNVYFEIDHDNDMSVVKII